MKFDENFFKRAIMPSLALSTCVGIVGIVTKITLINIIAAVGFMFLGVAVYKGL